MNSDFVAESYIYLYILMKMKTSEMNFILLLLFDKLVSTDSRNISPHARTPARVYKILLHRRDKHI